MIQEKKYNYFYKITNKLNGHYYYGVHCTNDIDDGYMGSGKRLHYAYDKYGIENFSKEILEYFDTKEEAFQYEYDHITEEMITSDECYNLQGGGRGKNSTGCVNIIDENGNHRQVSTNDPKWLDGTYVSISKNRKCIYDTKEKRLRNVYQNDEYFKKLKLGEYTHEIAEFCNSHKGCTTYIDKDGNICLLSVNDPRVLSGEFVGINKGKKMSIESIENIKRGLKNVDLTGNKNFVYGYKCIYKQNDDGTFINTKVKSELLDLYLNDGWQMGSKYKTDEDKKKHRKQYKNNVHRCSICGQIGCKNPFCKVHNRLFHIKSLVKNFGYDESKIGTLDVENEFNRIKNTLLEMKSNGMSNNEICNYYGNSARMDRIWKMLLHEY